MRTAVRGRRATRNYPVKRNIVFAKAHTALYVPFKIKRSQYGWSSLGIAKMFIAEANNPVASLIAQEWFGIVILQARYGDQQERAVQKRLDPSQ